MTTTVRVTDPADLDKINGLIHDQYFDLDEVHFDKDTDSLTIRFAAEQFENKTVLRNLWVWQKVRIPLAEAFLGIRWARDCRIEDPAQLGTQQLNVVTYDAGDAIVTVHGTPGFETILHVGQLDVEVEVTDKIIGHLDRSYLGVIEMDGRPKFERASPHPSEATQTATGPNTNRAE